MRLRTLLIALLVAIVLLPVAVIVALQLVGVDRFRPQIAARIAAATGREVAIDGPLAVGWSLRPTLIAEGLRIGNASWATAPLLLEAQRLEVTLALLPLLRREIEIDRILVDEAALELERDAAGRRNWADATADPAPRPAAAGPAGGGTGGMPRIAALEITDARLVYREPDRVRRLVIERASLAAVDGPDRMAVEVAAALDDAPLSLNGTVDSWRALATASGAPATLDLQLDLAGLAGTVGGTLAARPTGPELALALDLAAADGRATGRALGVDGLPAGPIRLAGRLSGTAERLALADLAAELAGSRLDGTLELALDGPRPRLAGALSADRVDLAAFEAADGAAGGGAAGGADGAIDAAPLRAVDLDLDLKIGRVDGAAVPLEALAAHLVLADGRLVAEPLTATVAGSPLGGRAALAPAGQGIAVETALRSERFDLGALLTALGQGGLLEAGGALKLDVTASGADVPALRRSLGGEVVLTLGEGRLRARGLERVVGGVREVAGALFGQDGEWVALRCAAVDMPIAQGVGELRVAVLDTAVSTVLGEGTIDLGRERLDLLLTPRANVATLNLAIPVRVRGSLANPGFSLDSAGAARRALTGVLGALVFPPAALAAFADLGVAGGCGTAAPTAGARGTEPAAGGEPGNVVRELDRAVRGLFGR